MSPDRRTQLRQLYGFDFPDDLFVFYDFARSLRPLEPLRALEEPLGVALVGPFEVLAGRFDGHTPRHSQLLHWRYHDDPPEFFTVLAGSTDGLHWGYYLDDPATGSGCIASYYLQDAYELSADGDTLFEAMRLHLEHTLSDAEIENESDNGDLFQEQLARLRERLMAYGTGDRPEVGDEYTERYAGVNSRADRVVAQTLEGLGIVVPPERYRPLSRRDRRLWSYLRKHRDPAEVVDEARQALAEGYPGTALLLGKNLWALTGEQRARYAAELLEAAYAALGREPLLRVLRTHLADRTLASVDILELESGQQSDRRNGEAGGG